MGDYLKNILTWATVAVLTASATSFIQLQLMDSRMVRQEEMIKLIIDRVVDLNDRSVDKSLRDEARLTRLETDLHHLLRLETELHNSLSSWPPLGDGRSAERPEE